MHVHKICLLNSQTGGGGVGAVCGVFRGIVGAMDAMDAAARRHGACVVSRVHQANSFVFISVDHIVITSQCGNREAHLSTFHLVLMPRRVVFSIVV